MENSKKKFEKEWKEYERLNANYERLDQDQNATKADVEKVCLRKLCEIFESFQVA